MKKTLIGLGVFLTVAVGALLVAPGFIDWNRYKPEIAAQVEKTTGRKVVFEGDISARILPAPRLSIDRMRLSNIDGAATPYMVGLRSLLVDVALAPLLGGKIQVSAVHLIDPVIELEALADGRRNWDFGTMGSETDDTAAAGAQPGAEGGGADFPIQIDSFVIENGTLTYRDEATGTFERIERINARLAAASLLGPFDAGGSAVVRSLPLGFELSVGKIIHGRTISLVSGLSLDEGRGKAKLSGTIALGKDGAAFRGNVKAEAADLAGLAGALAGGGTYPGFLAQPFDMTGAIEATAVALKTEHVEMRLGNAQFTAEIDATLGDVPEIRVTTRSGRVDLDAWLDMPSVEIAAGKGGAPSATGPSPATAAGSASPSDPFLPTNIVAAFDLGVDALSFRNGVIRQLQVSLALTDGEATVNQISALMPGGAEVAAFGFVSNPNGAPRFEGDLEAKIADLRGVLRWLAIDFPDVPTDRLRQMSLAGRIVATGTRVEIQDMETAFDGTRVIGGLAANLTERLSFGASLAVDRINLDAYMPGANGSNGATAPKAEARTTGPAKTDTGGFDLAPLKALTGFDANLNLRVDHLTYRGVAVQGAALDATLFNGALDLRQLGIGDLAGAAFQVKGKVEKLGTTPEVKGLTVTANAKDTTKVFALLGIEPPLTPAALGAVGLDARLDGSLTGAAMTTDIKAAGGAFTLKGSVTPLDLLTGFAADVTVDHPDANDLLRRLAIGYTPSGALGALGLKGTVKTNGKTSVAVENLSGSIGKTTVAGTVNAALAGAKPALSARLDFGDLVLDPFVPGDGQQAKTGARAATPAGAARTATPQQGGRWSREPIDMGGLHAVDADLAITAKTLTHGPYRLGDARIKAGLKDGVLDVETLTGTLFGGKLEAKAKVAATEVPTFGGNLSLANASVAQATLAATGSEAALGRLTLGAEFATAGNNEHALVTGLGGRGNFAVNGIDVNALGKGNAAAALLTPLLALNQLGGLVGGRQGEGLADMTGSFTAERGVVVSNDVRLTSNLGNGTAQGTADLGAWTIDASGEIATTQNLLTALLATKVRIPKNVPFTVRGPLDAPNVTLQTGQQPAEQQPAEPQPAEQPVQQELEKLKPQELFRRILRDGIGR